eukprot:jgi/Antlo1/140/1169
MALMKKIIEFQNMLMVRIKDEFGDITREELAERVLECEEFLMLEKDLNNILLSLDLKQVDSAFKRIDTANMRAEYNDLRRSLRDLLKTS